MNNKKMKEFNEEYPQYAHNIFKFQEFNAVQLGCYKQVMHDNGNIVVSAPTSSGKTVIFELAMIKQASQMGLKCLYLAPIKSLCHEKVTTWTKKFCKKFKISELTSDKIQANDIDLNSCHIVVATPQKIDFLSRKNLDYLSKINLLLIDQVHMLNLESRGDTLEAVISRIMSLNRPRILAVSATIPNIKQISQWLKVYGNNMCLFGEQYRPSKIEKVVLGFKFGNNPFTFQKMLNYKLLQVIRSYSHGKGSLVFCQTQKGTQSACQQLVSDMRQREFIQNDKTLLSLIQASKSVSNSTLQIMIAQGIGFHNAGLSLHDRLTVQNLFLQSKLKVLCTTSTLAMGINLPARLVVIKSTQCYRGSGKGYQEYTQVEIEQMMGRAGRPPFDTQGTVVIMTDKQNFNKYNNPNKLQTLESHLYEKLQQHINAQISLKTIQSFNDVIKYFKNSFCYIRMRNSPASYQIKGNFETAISQFCSKAIAKLKQFELINYSDANQKILPRLLGINVAKNSIEVDTIVQVIKQIENSKTQKDYLMLLCSASEEIKKFRNKLDERKFLKQLNEKNKYKLKCAISTADKKAFVLIQSQFDGHFIENWQMRKQIQQIKYFMKRLTFCVKTACNQKKIFFQYLYSCLYNKYFTHKFWQRNQQMIVRQIAELNQKWKTISMQGIKNITQVINNIDKLDCLCQKGADFSKRIIQKINNMKQGLLLKYQNQGQRSNLKVRFNGKFDETCKKITICVGIDNQIYAIRYLDKQNPETVFGLQRKNYIMACIKDNYIGFDEFYQIKSDGSLLIKNLEDISPFKEEKSNKRQGKSMITENKTNIGEKVGGKKRSKSYQFVQKRKSLKQRKSQQIINYTQANIKQMVYPRRISRKKDPSDIYQIKEQKDFTMKKTEYIPLNQYKCWKSGFPEFSSESQNNTDTVPKKLRVVQQSKPKIQKKPQNQYKVFQKIQPQIKDAYDYFYNLF